MAGAASSGLQAGFERCSAGSSSSKPQTCQLKLRSHPAPSCITPATNQKESSPPPSTANPCKPSFADRPPTASKSDKDTFNMFVNIVDDQLSSLQTPTLTEPCSSKDHQSGAPMVRCESGPTASIPVKASASMEVELTELVMDTDEIIP